MKKLFIDFRSLDFEKQAPKNKMVQLSRSLAFRLSSRKPGGGINWQNMDPSQKLIATKKHNPWTISGTPLAQLQQRLNNAGLHYPWMRNKLPEYAFKLQEQKFWYTYLHRHLPFALGFTLVYDIAQELYCQATGKHNLHILPWMYVFPPVYSCNRYMF